MANIEYIICRAMRVQVRPGVVELRQPGERVPEANDWPNPGSWVRRGYIKPASPGPIPGYDRGKLKPAVPAKKREPTPEPAQEPAPKLTRDGLLSMKNADLEDLGDTFGLQLHGAKKSDMVEAILEAQD